MTSTKITRLYYKNYLATIKALPTSKMFQHLYVVDENDREFDAAKNGRLSCALVVSSVLQLFNWIDGFTHATAKSTVEAMLKNGWYEIDKPKQGDIVHYPKGADGHEHIGFWMGDNLVISNLSKKTTPAKHEPQMKDGRTPDAYYTRNYNKS